MHEKNLNLKKIVCTGDIFRPNELQKPAQNFNITWLYAALNNHLKIATNLKITYLFSNLAV